MKSTFIKLLSWIIRVLRLINRDKSNVVAYANNPSFISIIVDESGRLFIYVLIVRGIKFNK